MNTPELDRLKMRLAGAQNFKVSITEGASPTPEQIAKQINASLDELERGEATLIADDEDEVFDPTDPPSRMYENEAP